MFNHNVNPEELHDRIMFRIQAQPKSPHALFPNEAFFVARTIKYVAASTSTIQEVITLIESDKTPPSDNVQKAHALLIQLRGK